MRTPWVGGVLCGGRSSRMGRDKCLIPIGGVPMARRLTDLLESLGAVHCAAIGGDRTGLAELGLLVVPDRWAGEGPLGGVLTALEWAAGSEVMVVACDLVALDTPTLQRILAHAERSPKADVVAAVTERIEPACALWRPSAGAELADRFARGERSLMRSLDRLDVVTVEVDPAALTNANEPKDLPPGASA